jgi:hypothetical protein
MRYTGRIKSSIDKYFNQEHQRKRSFSNPKTEELIVAYEQEDEVTVIRPLSSLSRIQQKRLNKFS